MLSPTTAADGPARIAAGHRPQASRGTRRLILAIAASIALHATAVATLRAGRGEGAGGGESTVARLSARLMLAPPAQSPSSPASAIADAEPARPPAPVADRPAGRSERPPRPAASGTLPLDLARTGQYYLASRLQVPPRVIGELPLEYPEDSPLRDGVVVARVLISAGGGVDEAVIESADPPGVFDSAAVRGLLKARFSPGSLHGIAVASQLLLEVRYRDPGNSTLPGVSVSEKRR